MAPECLKEIIQKLEQHGHQDRIKISIPLDPPTREATNGQNKAGPKMRIRCE